MTVDVHALAFLDQLEKAETGLLAWGLIDGFFSESEIEERAEQFLSALASDGTRPTYESAWDLVEALLEQRLLWKVPDVERYRTRMAETVRLFARLRQIFPDALNGAWRTAASLVADYRLIVRPRLYPLRDVLPAGFLQSLRQQRTASPLQEGVIGAFIRVGTPEELNLARFQVRATERILRSTSETRSFGTVVCSGTGTGKTLAFYLPAYAIMAERVSNDFWTKCLALYPRIELLKDQLREALVNARRVAPALATHGKRGLVIGALYGDVPHAARNVPTHTKWRRVTLRGRVAFECPFVQCPECGGTMAWSESDIQDELERLACTSRNCDGRVGPGEIRLTRQRLLAEPPDILFTSTEMLSQRLSSRQYGPLFGIGVRSDRRPDFVLMDEAHTYEGIHGAHVAVLLRRWRRAADAHPHYIGLSATLADAPRFFAELVGLGPGDVGEIAPEETELRSRGAEYMLALRGNPASGTSLLSTTIQSLMLLRRVLASGRDDHFGRRVFAFTDNLDVINRLYHNLLDAEGWDAFGRPNPGRVLGSLANLRGTTLPGARERLEVGQNWAIAEDIGHALVAGSRVRIGRTSSQDAGVDPDAGIIVATSALEVGFDDPDVGAMLQHKAPQSSAAFLQRKGRAGRRQEMRPWTVVVLSDYGRDRNAYHGYDQLFSPYLPPRHLPLGNRAVLRMQATYVLCDWLARRLPHGQQPDPWIDFSQPAEEIENRQVARDVDARQRLYVAHLRSLLEQDSTREELATFLSRSLAINQEEISAVMWEPPRSLMMEVVPTLLRRLERGWRRANSPELELHTARAPLPEFLPRALFSDLQVPDVAVRLPAIGRNAARTEFMPVAHALREFAPGRVSRRFGVSHGGERHWIAPGDGAIVSVDSFCPPADRQDLGFFRCLGDDGAPADLRVFRPLAIDVALTPLNVQQSSNSFLEWRTEIVPTAQGHEVDVPHGSPWRHVLEALSFHTHHLGMPLEVRRFAVGAMASVGRGRQAALTHSLHFVCKTATGEEPAAVGFAADVDGIQISFSYPGPLHELWRQDDRLARGLRAPRFRDLVRAAAPLDGLANSFQRDWLSQAYVSAITTEALLATTSLEQAEASVYAQTSKTSIRDVIETILQWSEEDRDHDEAADVLPRRLGELVALLEQPTTRQVLHEAARVLWQDVDEGWESWLRARFKATLGAALIDAAQGLCPELDSGALVVNINSYVRVHDPGTAPVGLFQDHLWLTETTIGGGGFVEAFLEQYAKDPRRYFRLVDASLGASDLESVGEELGRVLQHVSSEAPEHLSLSRAYEGIRSANSYAESTHSLAILRSELALHGIQPTMTLLVSMNARLLGPGTNKQTDSFMAAAVRQWDEAGRRLGIDIDARVFALVKSADSDLERALGVSPAGDSPASRASWRFGVIYGMLWPRGAQVRAESMRAWNPYERLPECDRLLVLAAFSHAPRQVFLSNAAWWSDLTDALLQDGAADLVGTANSGRELAEALVLIGAVPIDSATLLVHARLTGIRREGDHIHATIELPEVIQ
jgi:hypothetical protein